MNALDFNIPQGWPASTETFQWLQDMANNAQLATLLGGRNFILDGCLEAGGNVGNGLMVINGEVLPFEGGPLQPSVIVTDTATQRAFFGGAVNDYYHARKVVFGTGPDSVLYADIKRSVPENGVLARLDKVEKMLAPLIGYTADGATQYGSWLFWGRPASEIPAGWEPVPDDDWKGRVPVVLDEGQTEFDAVGKIGGEKTHTLSVGEIPELAGSIHYENQGSDGSANAKVLYSGDTEGNGSGNKTDVLRVNIGGGAAHNNLQPFKVVLFIRFIG